MSGAFANNLERGAQRGSGRENRRARRKLPNPDSTRTLQQERWHSGRLSARRFDLGEKNNIDLIVGDLNTYGSKVGSSTRSHYQHLSEGLATSSGNSPLDKALLKNGYYGLHSDVNANVMELEDIELPDVSYVFGQRSSARPSVAQSRQGRGDKSDHRPLVVMMPAIKLLSVMAASSYQP
jgi:hypothetical protein